MGACREGACIWYFLRRPSTWRYFRARRIWRSEYFWHDSFGKYWARAIGCRLFGHGKLQNVNQPGEPSIMHCFKCERSGL